MSNSRKSFDYINGQYYFSIKSSPNSITIFRKNRDAAVEAFCHYKLVGKEVEWLGKWNGKAFVESSAPDN